MSESDGFTGPQPATIAEILQWRALHQGDQQAYLFLKDGEQEGARLTYAQLDAQARSIAAHLLRAGAPGERALLLHPPGLEFIAAFFGCLYAGIIAVPLFPPRRNRPDPRIIQIAKDATPSIALTTREVLDEIEDRLVHARELESLTWSATEELTAAAPGELKSSDSSELAYLQYTSGSTSSPKGVMVTNDNVMHNLKFTEGLWAYTSESVSVSWIPHFHDMGLVDGILQPMFSGIPSIRMSPASFAQRPVRWLRAISRYRGTHGGSPNVGYELCVHHTSSEDRAGLDLTCWRNAYNGAEPVRLETLERFARTFEPCGLDPRALNPSYGLAESTLVVSGGEAGEAYVYRSFDTAGLARRHAVELPPGAPEGRKLVACGRVETSLELKIVEPQSRAEQADGELGEIWISGPSVAAGYWQRPQETTEIFEAHLADSGEGPFLRTGDLGFVADGRLYIAGRIKDLIIIRGSNHYPQDIEATVETCHPAIRLSGGAAFSLDIDEQERLAIVQEIRRDHVDQLNTDEVVQSIVRAVSENHELQVHSLLLIRPGDLPKTTSGKIARSAARKQFLDESFQELARWTAPRTSSDDGSSLPSDWDVSPAADVELDSFTSIRDWIISELEAVFDLGDSQIRPDQSFSELGLDSLTAVVIAGELQQLMRRPLDIDAMWKHPTVDALAQHLADQVANAAPIEPRSTNPRAQLAALQSGGEGPPLFCIAGIGLYADLARRLAPDRSVYGVFIPARGQMPGEPPPTRLTQEDSTEALAAEYLEVVRQTQPQGPYYLAGTSYGGVLAYEIARQLRDLGEVVELVAMFDSVLPGAVRTQPLRRIAHLVRQSVRLGPKAVVERIREKLGQKAIRAHAITVRVQDLIRPDDSQRSTETDRVGIARLNYFWELAKAYHPLPAPGRVVLFRALEGELFGAGYEAENGLGWTDLALDGLQIHYVPGDHIGMVHEPHVATLAETIRPYLSDSPESPEAARVQTGT